MGPEESASEQYRKLETTGAMATWTTAPVSLQLNLHFTMMPCVGPAILVRTFVQSKSPRLRHFSVSAVGRGWLTGTERGRRAQYLSRERASGCACQLHAREMTTVGEEGDADFQLHAGLALHEDLRRGARCGPRPGRAGLETRLAPGLLPPEVSRRVSLRSGSCVDDPRCTKPGRSELRVGSAGAQEAPPPVRACSRPSGFE